MSKIIRFILPLALLFHPDFALAQQSSPPPNLSLGDAIVTGFSGTVATDTGQRRPANTSAADLTFIDPDGASVRIFDIAKPGYVWDGRLFSAPTKFAVSAKDVGQVFGVALDDQPTPNVYVAATSVFGLNIVSRGRDGRPERRRKGRPGAGWMRGQFGLDLQGGPGAIYRIDGRTGVATLFANVTLDGVPNPGPGLGNLAYDSAHKQLFVSDLYTGMIHRFDLDGKELGHYDHGVAGLGAAKLPPVAFSPSSRPNIASDRFDSEKPNTWGFAPAARRVFGLAVHDDRLYYAVASGPQIWSVGIARDGSFAADPRWELDVPAQAGPLPVSDIAFSQKGAMILAQRGLIAGAYDYSAMTRPSEPQVFRIWPKDPKDPPSPGRWKLVPEEYAVGFAGNHRNTNGGIALGYGYDRDGALSTATCEAALWTTGQNLRNDPALRTRLDPGGPLVVHGIQGSPSAPVRNFNAPPWTSYFADYDGKFEDPRATGHLGSVRIYTKPCAPPAVYSGPGYPASPPYIVGLAVVTPPICVGSNCSPPATTTDIGIAKTGKPDDNVDLGYDFNLAVTNLGGPLTSPQTITVTDVVPAGMTFTSVTATNWTCTPATPIAAGSTMSCTYTGPFPVAASQLLGNIAVVASGGDGPYENCANVTLPGDGNASNDKSCVTVSKPQFGYLLVKKQVVSKVQGYAVPAQTYPVVVTCGSNSTTMNLASDGTAQAVNNLPYGTVCSVVEGVVTPPNICPQGTTPTFTTTYVPPGPVTINQASTTITVVNTFSCASRDTGSVTVIKSVTNTTSADLTNITYPVVLTCGSIQTSLVLTNGNSQTLSNMALGTNCSVTEDTSTLPMPAGACIPPTQPAWTATISPAVTISGSTATITVHNSLDCKGQGGPLGSLKVEKEIINHTNPHISTTGMVFAISASCQSGSNPAVVTAMPLADNGSQTVTGLALNTVCTVTEGAIGSLPAQPYLCLTQGEVPTWSTVIMPSTPVTIGSSPANVVVQNILDCKPGGNQGAQLLINKTVQNSTTADLTNTTYPATVTCGSVGTPLNLTVGAAQTVNNVPPGTTCTINEPLPPAPTTGCPNGLPAVWYPPVYTPSTVTMPSSGTATMTVANTLACERGSYVAVSKTIINNTQADVSGISFPVTVTCNVLNGDGSYPIVRNVSVTLSGSQLVHDIPANYVCTPVETLPSPPTTGCPAGQVPTWGSPVYTPPNGLTAPGVNPILTVQNVLNCAPQPQLKPASLQCRPPLVANAARTACVCRDGLVARGGKCVQQVVCRAPAKLNRAGTACICSQGMTRKGNTCVPQERRRPPTPERKQGLTPDDVIRGLPGMLGGGGRGRGGGGGRIDNGGGAAPKGGR